MRLPLNLSIRLTDLRRPDDGPSQDLEHGLLEQHDHGPHKPETTTPPPHRSTAYLDGLRGLAAFLVYVYHHVSWFYGPTDEVQQGYGWHGVTLITTLPYVRTLFTGGSAAVAIFFVLSGFVLSKNPLSMLRGGERSRMYKSLVSATAKRPFRLFIPPIGVSFVVALVMQLPAPLRPKMVWPESQANIFAELGNWFVEILEALNPFIYHSITTKWFSYDPPIWTMAAEFKGSMLVFALCACLSFAKPRIRAPILVVSGVLLLLLNEWQMACFIAGMVLAMDHLAGASEVVKRTATLKTVFNHIVFLLGWWLLGQVASMSDPEISYNTTGWYWMTKAVPDSYYKGEYWRFWHAVGAVMLLYATLRLHWLQRFLTTPALQYLGRVSFCLYLVHTPFLWTVADRTYRLFGTVNNPELQTWWDNRLPVPDVGPHGVSTRFLVSQAIILPMNLLLSQFATTLLDEPSVRLGQWIAAKLR